MTPAIFYDDQGRRYSPDKKCRLCNSVIFIEDSNWRSEKLFWSRVYCSLHCLGRVNGINSSIGVTTKTHGETTGRKRTPEYNVYNSMKRRCYSKMDVEYANYGGRGIKVSDEWLGAEGYVHFLSDMGRRPSDKHSIERMNANGNYELNNCKWATVLEQARNKRGSWQVFMEDEWVPMKDAAPRLGMAYTTLYGKVRGLGKYSPLSIPSRRLYQ